MAARQRDTAIDTARGIAIFFMIGANMAPVLPEPHLFLLRIASSLPAPVFVTLAGMMLARASGKSWAGTLRRVALLLGAAAFTDMAAWGIRPFMGVDVLYLMAMGTLALFALRRAQAPVFAALIAGILASTPLLQHALGYTLYPTERELISGNITVPVEAQTPVWHHYLVDGWFPLFPWLAFMLFGTLLGRWRFGGEAPRRCTGAAWIKGIALVLGAGAAAWALFPGALYSRQGFSELFYPPTVGFVLAAAGAVLAVIALCDAMRDSRLCVPFQLLGSHSLLVYVLHSIVIGRVLLPLWGEQKLAFAAYLGVWTVFAAAMLLVAGAWHRIRR